MFIYNVRNEITGLSVPTECDAVYLLYSPKKGGGTYVSYVSIDLEKIKRIAQKERAEYQKKGWQSWADKVKIKKPNDCKTCFDLAKQFIDKSNLADMAKAGYGWEIKFFEFAKMLQSYGEYLKTK